jgi:hypothetical protein
MSKSENIQNQNPALVRRPGSRSLGKGAQPGSTQFTTDTVHILLLTRTHFQLKALRGSMQQPDSDAKSDPEVEQLAMEVQEILYTLTELFSRDCALIQQQTEEVSLNGTQVLAL